MPSMTRCRRDPSPPPKIPHGVMMPHRELDPERLGDHLDRLFRAAWALCGSREDAEDLVQETYERVLRPPGFRRRDDDLTHLYRTLRTTFSNARRTPSRRPRIGAELDDVQPASL